MRGNSTPNPILFLFERQWQNQLRQMGCRESSEENITGSWWTVVAWLLMAVAAWVRRLPSRGSKSSVLTLWAQWVQVNLMPPLMRPIV